METQSKNSILEMSATQMAEGVRKGEISAVELVEAHLERIEEVNPSLNAVIRLTADEARMRAQEADAARARGEKWGPLHGVPMTVKDMFETKGIVSTAGTQGRAGFVPTRDATAVARMKAAGAIVLGKTNVPELSLAFESDNVLFGRTNNPYDLTRTAGGSSGGEAAIIAAGGSPLGIGTDAAGSLRIPSHYCGIATLKPTLGRVPMTGTFPPAMGTIGRMWAAGPLARRVEDLELALRILAGTDGLDPMTAPVPVQERSARGLKGLRVAYFTDNGVMTPTAETVQTVKRAARALQEGGAAVDEVRPNGIEQAYELTAHLFALDAGAGMQALLQMAGTTMVSPLTGRLVEAFMPFAPHAIQEVGGVLAQWDIFRATMYGFMTQFDVIVSPVNPFPAPEHGRTFGADFLPSFGYTMAHNLSGLPAAVVRGGTSPEGLPIGVQIVAAPWREDVALAAAKLIEGELGGWQAPEMEKERVAA